MSGDAPLCEGALHARRLGVLGGSFDPPHVGHLHAATAALAAFELDHVLFVPAAQTPHKPGRARASGEERRAMLALLLEPEGRASIWDAELLRPAPSYTVDTLRELRARLGDGTRLFLVLGEDNLAGLASWRAIEEILALAQPIIVQRRSERVRDRALEGLSSAARTRIRIGRLELAPCDASSSELRARLERREPASGLVPPAVQLYLEERGLYRGTGGG